MTSKIARAALRLVVGALTICWVIPSEATSAELHSSVKVTYSKGKEAMLSFATVPNSGLVANDKGPWRLDIKSLKGLTANTKQFSVKDWHSDISGFKVPVALEAGAKEAVVEYKMITFVCTKDKTICHRDVVEGKETVKL